MSDLENCNFTATHEWLKRIDSEGLVGITDHAQSQLGDVIFLELPAIGDTLHAGERFGVVESVKAASDLYSPVGGRVAAVNTDLVDHPERVNSDPYGEGWLVRLADIDETDAALMDRAAYDSLTQGT